MVLEKVEIRIDELTETAISLIKQAYKSLKPFLETRIKFTAYKYDNFTIDIYIRKFYTVCSLNIIIYKTGMITNSAKQIPKEKPILSLSLDDDKYKEKIKMTESKLKEVEWKLNQIVPKSEIEDFFIVQIKENLPRTISIEQKKKSFEYDYPPMIDDNEMLTLLDAVFTDIFIDYLDNGPCTMMYHCTILYQAVNNTTDQINFNFVLNYLKKFSALYITVTLEPSKPINMDEFDKIYLMDRLVLAHPVTYTMKIYEFEALQQNYSQEQTIFQDSILDLYQYCLKELREHVTSYVLDNCLYKLIERDQKTEEYKVFNYYMEREIV